MARLAPLALVLASAPAWAQDSEPTPPPSGEEPTPPSAEPQVPGAEGDEKPAENPFGEAPTEGQDAQTPSEQVQAKSPTVGWKDIVVVPRRAVLKRKRVEFMPTYNVSLNSPTIRHHGFGGQLNVWLSEAFFIGVEGTYYVNDVTDRYYQLGLQQRVSPSVNKYIFSTFLDFGYVPIYGKFTLFNKVTLHWEAYISAGVGIFQSEVLPRDPAFDPWSNILVGGLLPGFGVRMSANRWFSLDMYMKNYLFADKLEPFQRTVGDCVVGGACPAKDAAISQITTHVVFGLGVSFFLPPKFEYKTAR